ncbi:MAG: arylsulfatase [Cyclobacteriaceae bacterium]
MIRNFNKFKFSTPFSIALITMVIYGSCSTEREGNRLPKNPNIIVILADDMGYGDVSALNPESRVRTPAIDRMVNEGISFSNAHASASVCTPSRYGFLTGRYAFRSENGAFGIGGFAGPVIESGRETLASLLKEAGYHTGIVGKWHLGLDWKAKGNEEGIQFDDQSGYSNVDYSQPVGSGPNDYGFDYSFIHPASLDIPPYLFLKDHHVIDPEMILTTDVYPTRLENTTYAWDKKHSNEEAVYWEKGVWWRQGEMSSSFRIEDCHDEILEEGLSFIDSRAEEHPEQPFFLYMPLTGPHTPWVPTDEFKGKTPIGLYGDFVLNIDDVVEQVQNALIKHGIRENTILVFSSDNGAYWPQEEIELHDHDSNWGRRGQKGDIWEGGHRVPLIISWPEKIEKASVYTPLVSLIDFFATFMDLTGQKMSSGSGEDSFSFFHVLDGHPEKPVRTSMVHHSSGGMYSFSNENYKFIEGLGSGGFTAPQFEEPKPDGPQGQLYRIDLDSTESQNLFLEHPDLANSMSQTLKSSK